MRKTCIVAFLAASAFVSAMAQSDSVIVGTVSTLSGDDTVFVPVHFAIDEGYCFSHLQFTWSSIDDKIEALGIAPGSAEGWMFGVDSIDNVNNFISVIGENMTAGAGGRSLPFYLVFALHNPQPQEILIGREGVMRLGACDGLGGLEPALAPGAIRFAQYLPGDANSSGHLSGADVIYILSYLTGRRAALGSPPAADANGDCVTNTLDVRYLIDYFEGRGPEPVTGDCP